MKVLIPVFLVVGAAFAPLAHAQRSTHAAMHVMNSQHNGMAMPAMKMGMSGMAALKGQSGKAFNIAFMSQMIAHHQSAIDMARQALKAAKHAETKKEARAVITDQTKEIKQMTTWLQKWYGVKPSQDQADLMNADMKTMMEMKIEHDRMFFEMMVPHHQAAIEMSEMALKQSDRAEVKLLAQNIIKAQKAEITRYKSLLHHVK